MHRLSDTWTTVVCNSVTYTFFQTKKNYLCPKRNHTVFVHLFFGCYNLDFHRHRRVPFCFTQHKIIIEIARKMMML